MRERQGVARGDDGAARHGAWTGGDAVRANRHAFTLIELLVVITIIMVLVALIYPAATGVVRMALETQCQNHLNELGKITVAYCQAHSGQFPPPGDANAMPAVYTSCWLFGGTGGGRATWFVNNGIYYRDKLIGDPSVLWCPVHFEEYNMYPSGNEQQIYWKTKITTHNAWGQLWSSYVMNGNVYDEESVSRLSSDFTANHFLFIELHETKGSFNDGMIDGTQPRDILADRHEGYGFVACMDGHVIKMTKDEFDAKKTPDQMKYYWTPR